MQFQQTLLVLKVHDKLRLMFAMPRRAIAQPKCCLRPCRIPFLELLNAFNGHAAFICVVFSILFGTTSAMRAQSRVLGADISYWNCGTSATGISQSNWDTAYDTGNIRFVFLRASRGGTTGVDETAGVPGGGTSTTLSERYDDPRFVQNINRAIAAGIFAGSYHFGRLDVAGNTGTDEANHFIQMAGAWMRPGFLPPVFDLEAGSGSNTVAQFAIDFSDRIYAVMKIRPAIYVNGSYSQTLQAASVDRRDSLAEPAALSPSATGPAYPMLWDARYATTYDVQTDSPKDSFAGFYGPWDDYGDASPWAVWQYSSTVSIPGFNAVDSSCDANVAHGDIEYLKNFLVPAIWWNDASGDWSTLTNWNSGQTPTAPITPANQPTPYQQPTNGFIPVARLPGATGTGVTSGQYDTVIIERPNTNITVTVSTGTHNVRKLYMRETLNITGGSLTVNYDPDYRLDNSSDVLHGGPISAQFSGPVTLNGGSFIVNTLQVDTNRTFTLTAGSLTLNTINLMPHSSTPAKILINGNVAILSLSNALAVISNGAGTGKSGSIDLGAAARTLTIGNSTSDIDLSINVPITNGGFTKAGAGTLRLTSTNTYASGTAVTAGRLMVSNTSGSGTGTGTVTVSGGSLVGTGTISGAVVVSSGGTIAPGTTTNLGTLTLNTAPTFAGTNFMRVYKSGSPTADKIILTSGTLTYGGTLVVSNAGPTLTGGEVFTLYSATSYAGSFSATNLPSLTTGLNWYLGALVTNGTIKVNRRPVANTDTVTNIPTQMLQIPLTSLLANDTDADSDPLSIASITLTTTNGITLQTNSTYILYSNYVSVADQITYTITDKKGGTISGVVQVVPSALGRFMSASTLSASSYVMHLSGRPGWTYYVERSTNLPAFVTISTNIAPPSSFFDVTNSFTGPEGRPPASYYRLRWPNE